MKEAILLTILAVAAFLYFHSATPVPAAAPITETVSPHPANVAAVIIPGPSGYNRWKTGPNAQTEFEPFTPSEHATWNLHPGYTIVSRIGRH